MSHLIDLCGSSFGRLRVLEKAPSTGGQAEWICKCECGRITKVKGGHLRSGAIQSCGCYNKDRITESKVVDLTGKKFGKLTVIERVGSRNGRSVWKCLCDCGNYIETYASYLTTNDTRSCGCVISYREYMIEQYLKEHSIKYIRQYTFPDLRGKKYPLRFDFAILDDNENVKSLIEYQGEAHFSNVFKIPEEDYENALQRDEKKREYCKENQIPLYEITKEDMIYETLEDIICK